VGGVRTVVALTEVEAYDGANDPASHAFRGERPRNRSMFGAPGTLYVYRSYGVHWCMNVVCGPEGTAAAVLLRGGIPIEGHETIEQRRGGRRPLTVGPGNLTQALGVTGEHDGSSLSEGTVRLEEGLLTGRVAASPRIGITRATDRLWRLVLTPSIPSPPPSPHS
jgi:DNA-3-methyladenine glycosylase